VTINVDNTAGTMSLFVKLVSSGAPVPYTGTNAGCGVSSCAVSIAAVATRPPVYIFKPLNTATDNPPAATTSVGCIEIYPKLSNTPQ